MEVSLRQRGGSLGVDRTVSVKGSDLTVADAGAASTRTLTEDEAASVGLLAEQLVKSTAAGQFPGDPYASDGMTTEVEVGDARARHRYEVQSGGAAPAELWALVGTLDRVAARKVDP